MTANPIAKWAVPAFLLSPHAVLLFAILFSEYEDAASSISSVLSSMASLATIIGAITAVYAYSTWKNQAKLESNMTARNEIREILEKLDREVRTTLTFLQYSGHVAVLRITQNNIVTEIELKELSTSFESRFYERIETLNKTVDELINVSTKPLVSENLRIKSGEVLNNNNELRNNFYKVAEHLIGIVHYSTMEKDKEEVEKRKKLLTDEYTKSWGEASSLLDLCINYLNEIVESNKHVNEIL